MLDFIRKNAGSWIIKLTLFIIIVVFIFWGIGGLRGRREGIVAQINNYTITQREYQLAYNNFLQIYQKFYPEGIPEDILKKLNLKQKTLDELITRAIMLQEARKLSLEASADEVREAIRSNLIFQENGVFNSDLYKQFLQTNRLTPEEFESELKADLTISKLEKIISSLVKVSDKEVFDEYLKERQEIDLWYLKIDPPQISSADITEKEKIEYFQAHAQDFKIPTLLKIKYLIFDPKNYEDKVFISPQEVTSIYQSTLYRFSEPKKIRARHILIKISPSDSKELILHAKSRAEEILQKIKNGEDFVALAEKYSEDIGTAKKGGDLGYFQQGQMAKAFEEAAFSLKKGEVSQVVQTPYGFHIIKVEDIIEPRIKPIHEVKEEIIRELRHEKALELAEKEAKEAYNQLYRNKDLDRYSREKGIPLIESPLGTSNELLEKFGVEKDLVETALTLKKDIVSTVIKSPSRFYLLKVTERKEQHIPSLDEVRQEVEKVLLRKNSRSLAQQKAKRILDQLKKGEPIKSVALKEKISLNHTGFFGRRDNIVPGLGLAITEKEKEKIFLLTSDHPYLDEPLSKDEAFYLISLKERRDPSIEQFRIEEDSFRKALLKRKQRETFQVWLENVRKEYSIEIFSNTL